MKPMHLFLLLMIAGLMAGPSVIAAETIQNPATPARPLGLKLVKTGQFPVNVPDRDLFVSGPCGFINGPDGSFYVTEAFTNQIHHFAASGSYLGSFAGKGQGPGQISTMLNGCVPMPDGTVAVLEGHKRSVHLYDADGVYRNSLKTNQKLAYLAVRRDVDGLMLAKDTGHLECEQKQTTRILVLNDDFSESTLLFESAPRHTLLTIADARSYPFCADREGNLLVATGERGSYEILRIAQSGEVRQRILRDYDPISRTEEEIQFRREGVKRMADLFGFSGGAGLPEPDSFEEAIVCLDVDQQGRIWVLARQNRDGEGKEHGWFDVYAPDGRLIDAVEEAGADFTFHDGKMHVLNRDEEGDYVIQTYIIQEPQGGTQ